MSRRAGPDRPLARDARELAERYVPWARRLAAPRARAFPRLRDELNSAALLALTQAARDFDPARGVRFTTFAGHRILGALRDCQRREVPRGYGRDPGSAPRVVPLSDLESPAGRPPEFAGRAPGPGAALHDADAVDHLLRPLPGRYRATLRLLYAEDLSCREAAARLGVHPTAVSKRRDLALGILRGCAGGR